MNAAGKVITARGLIEPADLGRVLMHEHLHSDTYDWEHDAFITEERPTADERRDYLLREAVPHLKACHAYGCHAYVEATPGPWRAWPTTYVEVAEAANMHIVLCTGSYREMEVGSYWVKRPEDRMDPFVIESDVDQLADRYREEITAGIHGTKVCAGAIKVGTSGAEITDLEGKTFRAAARAQQATGVHLTTHCTGIGAETSQLALLDDEGVDLSRVVIGHTAGHLMDPHCRKVCVDWMRRGANFLPTNLNVTRDGPGRWQPLVDAVHEVFDLGLGDRLILGLDSGYCSESGPLAPMTFLPPPPFAYMFTDVLVTFRKMGLTEAEEDAMMRVNPQRIIPVQ